MVIDPAILLPIAAFAVLLVVLFIRAVSGHRQATVNETSARDFLRSHEPFLEITALHIDIAGKTAVVSWQETDKIGLIRAFGDKLVLQTFVHDDIRAKSGIDGGQQLLFPRQGIAHPPTTVHLASLSDFPIAPPVSVSMGAAR